MKSLFFLLFSITIISVSCKKDVLQSTHNEPNPGLELSKDKKKAKPGSLRESYTTIDFANNSLHTIVTITDEITGAISVFDNEGKADTAISNGVSFYDTYTISIQVIPDPLPKNWYMAWLAKSKARNTRYIMYQFPDDSWHVSILGSGGTITKTNQFIRPEYHWSTQPANQPYQDLID